MSVMWLEKSDVVGRHTFRDLEIDRAPSRAMDQKSQDGIPEAGCDASKAVRSQLLPPSDSL